MLNFFKDRVEDVGQHMDTNHEVYVDAWYNPGGKGHYGGTVRQCDTDMAIFNTCQHYATKQAMLDDCAKHLHCEWE